MLPKCITHHIIKLYSYIVLIHIICILLITQGVALNTSNLETQKLDKQVLNFTEATKRHGYTSEEHKVVTEDGYILTIFRIKKGKKCIKSLRKAPVILSHGLLLSSDAWIDAGPKAGLAYLLADACYDVWVGNQRGNYYAHQHVRLNPHDEEFWDFSLDEIGLYDIPATIDYVLNATGEKQVNFIGFSQGSGTLFVMCSEKSGYCDKVKLMIALAPAARLIHMKSLALIVTTKSATNFEKEIRRAAAGETFSKTASLTEFMRKTWRLKLGDCELIKTFIDSCHPGSISEETLKAMNGHFPAETSLKNLIKYDQAINSYKFQKFDYGKYNMKKYGKNIPPPFNLTAVTAPTVVLYGKSDYLVDVLDVLWLVKKLPNILEVVEVADPLWNHFDFTYSQHIREMVFPKVLQYLELYNDGLN